MRQNIEEHDIVRWHRPKKHIHEVGTVYGETDTHYLVRDIWNTPYSVSKKNRTLQLVCKHYKVGDASHYITILRYD
jgi:hypothetical protein